MAVTTSVTGRGYKGFNLLMFLRAVTVSRPSRLQNEVALEEQSEVVHRFLSDHFGIQSHSHANSSICRVTAVTP